MLITRDYEQEKALDRFKNKITRDCRRTTLGGNSSLDGICDTDCKCSDHHTIRYIRISDYSYSDDSSSTSNANQAFSRVVTIEARTAPLLEPPNAFNSLKEFISKSKLKNAARKDTWFRGMRTARRMRRLENLYSIHTKLTDRMFNAAATNLSRRKKCTCLSKKIMERYKRLWEVEHLFFEEHQSPYKQILLASLPIVVSLFLTSLYSLIDTMIVSRYYGTREIAAILNFLPFEQILTLNIMQALGSASASQISVALGAGRPQEAEQIFSIFFLLGCCTAVTVPLIFIPFLHLILPYFGIINTYIPDMLRYGYIVMTFMPFCNFLGPAMTPILRCENKAILVMLRQLLGTVLNIILDLIFITGLKLGNSGAAVATVISSFISGIWISSHFFMSKRKRAELEQSGKMNDKRLVMFNSSDIRCTRKHMFLVCRIFGLSLSSYIQFFLLSFGALLSLILHKYWMPEAIAHVRQVGVSIAARTTLIFSSPISGIQNGILPILGYTIGLGSPQKIYDVSRAGLVILFIATTFQLALFQALAPFIIRIYNLDEAYFTAGVRALRIINAVVPMLSFSTFALVLFQVKKMQYRALALQICKVIAQVSWQLIVPYIQKDSKELVAAVPFSDGVVGLVGLIIVIYELQKMKKNVKTERSAEDKRKRITSTFDSSFDGSRYQYSNQLNQPPWKQVSFLHGDYEIRQKTADKQSYIEMTESSTATFLGTNYNPSLMSHLIASKSDTGITIELSSDMGDSYGENLPQYYKADLMRK